MRSFNRHNHRYSKRVLLFATAILLVLSYLSSLYFRTQPSVYVEQKSLQKYIHQHQKDFNELIQDSLLMRKLVQQNESLEEFKKVAQKQYGVFLFAETVYGPPEILFWNNQKILPPSADFSLADGEYFQRLANGYYVIEKRTIKHTGLSSNVIAYAMIPVMSVYDVRTDYLYNHFAHSEDADKKIALSAVETKYPIQSLSGKQLFFIERRTHAVLPTSNTITVVLRLAALVLLLVYLHFTAESLTRRKGALIGIGFLILVLVAIRVLIFQFPNVFYFRQYLLFDPSVYAANLVNRSLGDLLLNAILFCWVVVFAWFHIGAHKRLPAILTGRQSWIVGLVALCFLMWSTFQLADVVKSLVADSKISFYVTDFFTLNFYTVIGFVVLALLSLSYYYFSRLLYRIIFPAFKKPIYVYFVLALVGLIYLSLQSGSTQVLFYLPVLAWLIIYTLLLTQEQFIINRFRITVAGILFWICVFSISLSAIILQENREKEWVTRKVIAEKHDELTDPSAERTLSIGLRYLDNRFLLNNYHRFADPVQNRYLRDSIIRENISTAYINSYNIKIFVFDTSGHGINNTDPLSYSELNNIFTVRSKPTEIPDLYYHESSYDQFTYITKRPIVDTTGVIGYFFIISTPKKYGADALYPELLRQMNRNDVENSPVYSYAIYNNNQLASASTKYPFPTNLMASEVPKGEIERRINGDYDELWYKANNRKVVVVVKKQDSLIESITLFSYLFCAFLFMIALLQFISMLLKAGNDWRLLNAFWQLNIRTQVHGTIIFISVLSFIIIGVATISFFIDRYNRNNIDKLSRTSGIMIKEMQKNIFKRDPVTDTTGSVVSQDSTAIYELQKLIDEVADIHNVDVNVYDLEGNLQAASESEVYSKGILSTKMHPEAYYHLHRLRQVQYVQQESMSSLQYLSIYSAVRDERGRVLGYLNIPYFSSQIDLKQEISNFLVTIINLNAFIFLVAGTIALFIANKVTRSFSVIGDKMKEITLGKANEEIRWNRNDEIGELVKQYNKMVRQLEQSAVALAKSEREGAWREMARQVAHEIKNPLTPMKLSIQYLQKAINNNQANVKELTTSVANTLIEQIDHLSKIAADFGRFANIGNRNLEIFDLHQVLESLKELYSSNPKVQLIWRKAGGEILMEADRTHMNRLFTNLLSNAIDACEHKEVCRIEIIEQLREGSVLVQVKDNGEGIPEEMQPRIFTPNFTTKTSGTGLGLAMCKSITEQAGGNIWFQTSQGQGTTFFVELPVID